MDSTKVIEAINEVLPDDRIHCDLKNTLKKSNQSGQVKVYLEDEDKIVALPNQLQADIISKAFFKEYFDIRFGTGYRVQISLGGIETQKNGIIYPKLCFATLFYDMGGKMLMIEFHERMK